MTDAEKKEFIRSLFPLLEEGGQLLIGDIAFDTREALEACRKTAGDEWDDDEIYFVYEEIRKDFPSMKFCKLSHCAGLLSLEK